MKKKIVSYIWDTIVFLYKVGILVCILLFGILLITAFTEYARSIYHKDIYVAMVAGGAIAHFLYTTDLIFGRLSGIFNNLAKLIGKEKDTYKKDKQSNTK